MKKKHIILGCILAVFICMLSSLLFLLKQKHDFRKTIANIPEFCLPQSNDSLLFCNTQIVKRNPMVLMYLHPECDICQIEAQQMQQRLDHTGKIQWILVSYAERDSLNKFTTTYRLNEIPDLNILMDSNFELYNRLQVKGIPSCYIYNRQHKLVKVLKGIEKLETIIKLANR